jgi:hypothetical protein
MKRSVIILVLILALIGGIAYSMELWRYVYDSDEDGHVDAYDVFPYDPSEWSDIDGDGYGDNIDKFPKNPNEYVDSDGDHYGDNEDAFPNDPAEHLDSDGDGHGDNSDAYPNDPSRWKRDSDGDGYPDDEDAFPHNPKEHLDSDGDHFGDNEDEFPYNPKEHIDSDKDGFGDNEDAFPHDPTEHLDSDGDGRGDNKDAYPYDPDRWSRYPDKGDFIVEYSPIKNQDYKDFEDYLKTTEIFENIASLYNDLLALPNDIPIYVSECGTQNAYYYPEGSYIVFCYELQDLFSSMARSYYSDTTIQNKYYDSNLIFTLNHEIAHALIDNYDLPVLGKEEDAADQLATYIMVDEPEYLIYSAMNYLILARIGYSGTYWDEHPLSEQRYYNILCWAYGSDSETLSWVVEEGFLPYSRAVRCESEYEKLQKSWDESLGPYMK